MPVARPRRYAQVDVFTARAGYGNPLAVVFDADDLDSAAMQHFAAWTHLSETSFVLAPSDARADFRLRIFTPRSELPFAGHPTVGTTYAVLAAHPQWAGRDSLVLECAAGLLPASIERGARTRIFVLAPPATLEPVDAFAADFAHALGEALPAAASLGLVDVGARWLIAELADAGAVRRLAPDLGAIATATPRARAAGLAVFGREHGGDAAIAVRAFCPADGINEDPVTGSANAAIGAWLFANGRLSSAGLRYRASQGREVGRDGYVDVIVDAADGRVRIGGDCVTCIEGTLEYGGTS